VTEALVSWNAGAAQRTVMEFVGHPVSDGIPAAERVAVFDHDRTLWCAKPMPVISMKDDWTTIL
jgi:hypothetical protein